MVPVRVDDHDRRGADSGGGGPNYGEAVLRAEAIWWAWWAKAHLAAAEGPGFRRQPECAVTVPATCRR